MDRNQAPETYITAAPQDTVTLRDDDGNPIRPEPGTIAVRFHPYWAGADQDGEVVGFYYAVVETLPLPPPGLPRVPPLPGPKAQDYRFTTRSDSTFIFTVSEFAPDRQHAFFIYAVDNQGKADPTPARVIFNALDRFPPIPIFEIAQGTGPVYFVDSGGNVDSSIITVPIRESLTPQNASSDPLATVPLAARLDFRWRAEPTIAGTYVTGYRYKLDETHFISVDASVQSVSYNTGINGDVIQPGRKVFTLRVLDQANGARDSTRRFRLNFPPDTWFSGPDSSDMDYPRLDSQGRPNPRGERWVGVADWPNGSTPCLPFSGVSFPHSLLGCDSLLTWPAERPEMKTFFEIYDPDGTTGPSKDRVYIRSEGDTVHINSWVILHNGGSDKDSPYSVIVNPVDPTLCGVTTCAAVPKALVPGPPNGSPIAFRSRIVTLQDFGRSNNAPFTNHYPNFDPVSNLWTPVMALPTPMTLSGKAFAWVRALDGSGDEDLSVGDGMDLAQRVDANFGVLPGERELRKRKVMTFYVNKAPALLFDQGGFVPRPGQVFTNRDRRLTFNLLADDVDPYDPRNRPPQGAGLPSTTKILRWRVWVKGQYANGDTALYRVERGDSLFNPVVTFDLPPTMVGTEDVVTVQLCDCETCESQPGTGRCVFYDIPIRVPAPSAGLTAPDIWRGRPGPGPSNEGKRSREP